MNYQTIHDDFISSRRDRLIEDTTQYERHHIIPRCLGGGNEEENIILLTLREHIFIHRILSKLHPSHPGLNYSVVLMTRGKYGNTRLHPRGMLGKKQGQRCKDLLSEYRKKHNPNLGKPPWKLYNGVTEVWSMSQVFYERWLELDKPSYSKLCSSFGIKWRCGHQNMVNKFRRGWVPSEDKEWKQWMESINGV